MTLTYQFRKAFKWLDKVTSINPVLYSVSILAFLNILGHIQQGHLSLVLYFTIIALALRNSTSNMALILGIPMIFINFLSLYFFKYSFYSYFYTNKDTETEGFTKQERKDLETNFRLMLDKYEEDNEVEIMDDEDEDDNKEIV